MESNIDILVDKVTKAAQTFSSSKSQHDRATLSEYARQLHLKTSTLGQISDRIMYGPLQQMCVRAGLESGILEALAGHNGEISVDELAAKTSVGRDAISRVMYVLAHLGIAGETGPARYQANEVTTHFLSPGVAGGAKFFSDVMTPVNPKMVEALAAKDSDARCGTPFEAHYGKAIFSWLSEHDFYLNAFRSFMAGGRGTTPTSWYSIFPAVQRLPSKSCQPNEPFFVDVGGNHGRFTTSFRASFGTPPPGRFIVQDRPEVIALAQQSEVDGVDFEAHDFLQPQPAVGAAFYFLKAILHDWPDETCTRILKHLAAVMTPGHSTLLIHETVLPEQDVPLREAYVNITLWATSGGRLRKRSQYQAIIESAGLEIVKIWPDEPPLEGDVQVIECRLRSGSASR